MRSYFARLVILLVCLLAATASPGNTQSTNQCTPLLLPQIHWETFDTVRKVAYLKLIDRTTFASERKGGGIGLALQDLGLSSNASYEDFDVARNQYIESTRLRLNEEQSLAVFRQTLTSDQLKYFVECLRTTATGVRLFLSDDTKDGVNVKIAFSGQPGRSENFRISTVGGQVYPERSSTLTLPHGGDYGFFVKRKEPNGDIRIIANGAGMSASAFSFGTLPVVVAPPCPKIEVTRITPVGITASQNSTNLSVLIDNDLETSWNSGGPPTQWVEFQLARPITITSIEFTPLANCNCPAHYQVVGFSEAGASVTLGTLDAFLKVEYSGGPLVGGTGNKAVNYKLGLTLDTTHKDTIRVRLVGISMNSWVAFREVALFGYPSVK